MKAWERKLTPPAEFPAEPELVDLAKIDKPFGELDERTQDRLVGAWARGATVQFYRDLRPEGL